jgi:hypothetical protein
VTVSITFLIIGLFGMLHDTYPIGVYHVLFEIGLLACICLATALILYTIGCSYYYYMALPITVVNPTATAVRAKAPLPR